MEIVFKPFKKSLKEQSFSAIGVLILSKISAHALNKRSTCAVFTRL